ncbi:MAG: DUF998 domain-containing protein [Bacteroidales bacterium]|jgi:hypothetical protein|nr:DUF998 domain-containing protein [Bacteroidales bacterium]MDD4672382.1 DUF998 domain-containing protein [Bacteroidales bacterium]MDY0347455.1 DUF998 domain-containing protein [Tenuifilaceae bacterium]
MEMRKTLIKQAIYLPVVYFGTLVIASLFANDYSHIGQHASELAINSNKIASSLFSVGIFITGLSMIFYGIGLILKFKGQLSITSFLITLFGITFLFGTFYKIGSPWHGLYGVGLSIMLLPFAFLYELGKKNINKITEMISIIVALIIFLYFWAMVARLDPLEQRGLTQRVFGLFVFGFISYSAHKLNKLEKL